MNDISRVAEFVGAQLLGDSPIDVDDEAVLALILGYVDRSVDDRLVARRLFAEFGTLASIFAASPDALAEVIGMTPRTIASCKFINLVKLRSLKSRLPRRISIIGNPQLEDYLRTKKASAHTESFSVLFLDSAWHLMREHEFAEGTVDHVAVYLREIVKRALQIGASNLVLLHNHPSRIARPSHNDIEVTRIVIAACDPLGITIVDHVIIAGDECISMRNLGMLPVNREAA